MKKLILGLLLAIGFLSTGTAQYQTVRTGFPGDDFSLEGAIDLFKRANSVQDFEFRLNRRSNYVNNLDLDWDGRTDYLRVEERNYGDFHAIIIQAPLGRNEVQDIAVIQIEKTGRRRAVLQIIGDEFMYGDQVIVEPFGRDGYSYGRGPAMDVSFRNRIVNVWYWPVVQDIFGFGYRGWNSPYYYSYYPTWWSPWDVYDWSWYNQRRRNYYRYCRVTTVFRVRQVDNYYRPNRVFSPRVRNRCVTVWNTDPVRYRNQINRINTVNDAPNSGRVSRKANNRAYAGKVQDKAPVRTNPSSGVKSRKTTTQSTRRANDRSANTRSTTQSGKYSRYDNSSKSRKSTYNKSSRTAPAKSKSSSTYKSSPIRSKSTYKSRSTSPSRSSSSVNRSQRTGSNKSYKTRSNQSSTKRSQPKSSSSYKSRSSSRSSSPSKSYKSSSSRSSSPSKSYKSSSSRSSSKTYNSRSRSSSRSSATKSSTSRSSKSSGSSRNKKY